MPVFHRIFWICIIVAGVITASSQFINTHQQLHSMSLSYKNELLDEAKKPATIDSSNYNKAKEASKSQLLDTEQSPWPDELPKPELETPEPVIQRPGVSPKPSVQPRLPHHAP